MRTPDLPPECYPATIRLPASCYPLRDDNDLIELVGRLCGEDARDLLRQRLKMQPMDGERKRLAELMEDIQSAADDISCALANIERSQSIICKEFVEV